MDKSQFMTHEISNRRFKKSKVVKLMLIPTGPLTQFMLNPLNSPPIPCSLNTACVMVGKGGYDAWPRENILALHDNTTTTI